MFPQSPIGVFILILACAAAASFGAHASLAQSQLVLFPSASIDSACAVNLFWYSSGARDTTIPSLPEPPVAWLESPPATAWVAAARIRSPHDSTVLYALDVQLKCLGECSSIAVGLRSDTGAPGSALGVVASLEPLLVSGSTYRVYLNTPLLMRADSSFFACIYWSASDRFALGEGHAVSGSAFSAFQSGYVATQWQSWSDYSLSISGVFARPLDTDAPSVPNGDSVAIWRREIGYPDSLLAAHVDALELHASDFPPYGRDVDYLWHDDTGTRVAALAVPVARATALQWLNFTPPAGGLKDLSQISATLRNWSDSMLQVTVLAQCSWSDGSAHSGPPPRLDSIDSVIEILPRSETTLTFIAHVDIASMGLAFVRIEASDHSPLHARVAVVSESLLVGPVGVDDGVGGQRASISPWPNPCSGVLHVPPARSVDLVNLLGRRVAEYDSRIGASGGVWDLSSLRLPAGIYWLRVRTAAGTRVHKLTLLK